MTYDPHNQLLQATRRAYVVILSETPRHSAQMELCELRDAIADAAGIDSQTVQDDHEEAATKKKFGLR